MMNLYYQHCLHMRQNTFLLLVNNQYYRTWIINGFQSLHVLSGNHIEGHRVFDVYSGSILGVEYKLRCYNSSYKPMYMATLPSSLLELNS
ncbi:hypothetical protein GDO81_007349 [Engystomops pustulosus]|uniref:Uncharacterized protein n=1 Tax=Engystomops pustulosus TaxID=76066 RepID=A0AAV7C7K1_ENGPU|nr:hypothetical protein GDO81_007349 [Engystomops pustulosus]